MSYLRRLNAARDGTLPVDPGRGRRTRLSKKQRIKRAVNAARRERRAKREQAVEESES